MHFQLKLSFSTLRHCSDQRSRIVTHFVRSTCHYSNAFPASLCLLHKQILYIQAMTNPHVLFDDSVEDFSYCINEW